MRYIWLSVLALCALTCAAQQKVDPSVINWPAGCVGAYIPGSGQCQPQGTAANPAGSSQQVQVNSGGSFATDSEFTDNPATHQVGAGLLATKLPRVNVTFPDFGAASSCANTADPTGVSDSTCAIQAAIAWATAHPQGATYAPIYFPAGTYKISAPLVVTCEINIIGDGEDATIIEPTNNGSNAFTVYQGSDVQPDLFTCNGSIEGMTIYAPSGHLYTATLIELDNTTGYTIDHVRGANSGGRGLATGGYTERLKVIDTEWDTNRWSIVAQGNELKFLDTQIAPGADATGYCYDVNCINGVFPPYTWNVAQQLISATGNGTTGTYVVKGGTDANSTNGLSPMAVGNYFTVAGIPDVTGLNGVYEITSLANNSPVSGEYTVTAANTASGTATVAGATYKPTILPDNNSAAFYFSGAAINILGGSIKANWHQACFQAGGGVFSGLIQGFYCEGFPVGGQPHMEADILANGLPPWTSTAGAIASNAMPVASTYWFPNYINDPNDFTSVESNSGQYRILPQDFVKGSSTTSAYVSGVQQGQYENVSGIFSGDGQFHIDQRNETGSTAPANTAWPAGSIIALVPQGNYGTLQVSNSHFEDVDAPGSNWAAYCNDTNQYICGDAIVGSIPNGYTTFSTGAITAFSGAPAISVSFMNDEFWGFSSAGENLGEGYVKISIDGSVTESFGGLPTMPGETDEVANGQYVNSGNVYAVQEADSTYAISSYSNPTSGQFGVMQHGPFYEGLVDNSGDAVLGENPNSGDAMGHQFAGSTCWYDVPPSGQPHSLTRFCIEGGPNNTGSSVGFELDTWSGSTWVAALSVKPNSGDTGGTVGGYIGSSLPLLSAANAWASTNQFGPSSGSNSTIGSNGIVYQNSSGVSQGGVDHFGNAFTNGHAFNFGVPGSYTGGMSSPSNGVFSFDTTTNGNAQGTAKALSFVQNGYAMPSIGSYEGTAVLVAGTATVSTTLVSSSSNITLSNCGVNGTQGMLSRGAITAGTSFVINSSSNTDTSTVCWWIH